MRYVLTGGGTGGHVYPNLAMAGELARRDQEARFLYLGVKGRAEEDIVPRYGIPLRFVPARGLPTGMYSPAMLLFLLSFLLGTLKALWLLLRFRPRLVVGTGGYVSAPVFFAARLLRRPILVHEQNAYPGLVNRTFGKLAGRVCVTFKESLVHFQHNGVEVGYPVRPEILALRQPVEETQRRAWKTELGIEPHRRVVLVTGGSLGARSINRALAEVMPRLAENPALRDEVFVLHGVGRFAGKEYDAEKDTAARLQARGFRETEAGKFYRRERYLYDIEKWLRVADVIVCRAGAGSLAETMAVGTPAIVIPKSGLPGDHQVKNAETMAAAGACRVIQESRASENGETYDAVDGNRLLAELKALLAATPEQLAVMRRATERFVTPDCLTRLGDEAAQLMAGPRPRPESVARRRTWLVQADGRRLEVLFDRTRVGSGRWDDVRLTAPGWKRKHFWLRRTSRAVNGRVEEFWTLLPRLPLLVRRADRAEAERVAGPVRLGQDDVLLLPDGAELRFAYEWREVEVDKSPKGAIENVFSQGLGTLASKVVGFGREAVLARWFGAGVIMDVFAVALSLANFMREVVAEMALENAFLPSFRLFYGRENDKRPAWRLAWQVFNLFFLLSAAIAALGILTCKWWIPLVARFQNPELVPPTIAMTKLMFPFLILMSISAFLGTLLQSFDRFGPNAFAPVAYSVAMLIVIWILWPSCQMYALALGVLAGGALQIVFQFFFLLRRNLRRKIDWRAYRPFIGRGPGVKKVAMVSGPVFGDAMINKVSGFIDKVLATPLIAGSVSALYYSRLLVMFPFSIIAMSINRVFLRDLSDIAVAGDRQRYRDVLQRGIEATLMLMVPTTAVMIALATPLVRFVFEGGSFDADDTIITSAALIAYAVGLLGWSLTSLYSRVFSSQLDTRTSMTTNAGSLAVYLVAALLLVRTPLAHAGLALATSLAFTFNMIWRHLIIARRLALDETPMELRSFLPMFFKTVTASVVMILVIRLSFIEPGGEAGFWTKAWAFAVPSLLGLFVFLLFAYLLRLEPLLDLLNHYAQRNGLGRPFGRNSQPVAEGPLNIRALAAAGLLAEAQRRPFSADEMAIARERLDLYLGHDDWWIRNLGIKLIGALRLRDRLGDLTAALTVERQGRASYLSRLFDRGRDVGFVRRNALTSLVEIGFCDDRVRTALLAALDDPYYEVRQFALRAAIAFAEDLRGRADFQTALEKRLHDRHFEVVPAAVRAYAELAVGSEAFIQLLPLLDDPRWPVRAATVEACRRLYDRGVLTDATLLRNAVQQTMLAGEMVEPVSPLKRSVMQALAGLPEE